jgi:hypothetical protein
VTADIVAIGGLGTTALSIVAIIILVYAYRGAGDKLLTSYAAEFDTERRLIHAETDRDAALAGRAKAEAERDAALKRLAATSIQRNDALMEREADVATEAATSPDAASALAVANRELAGVVSGELPSRATAVPTANPAAGTNHGDAR